jgi:hypothetical protein
MSEYQKPYSDHARDEHDRMARRDAAWFTARAREKGKTVAEYFARLKKYCEKSIGCPVNVASLR